MLDQDAMNRHIFGECNPDDCEECAREARDHQRMEQEDPHGDPADASHEGAPTMASLEILNSDCHAPKCKSRAVCRVRKANGDIDGDYCSRHGQQRVSEIARDEREAKVRS